jgi:hypothetical protein
MLSNKGMSILDNGTWEVDDAIKLDGACYDQVG